MSERQRFTFGWVRILPHPQKIQANRKQRKESHPALESSKGITNRIAALEKHETVSYIVGIPFLFRPPCPYCPRCPDGRALSVCIGFESWGLCADTPIQPIHGPLSRLPAPGNTKGSRRSLVFFSFLRDDMTIISHRQRYGLLPANPNPAGRFLYCLYRMYRPYHTRPCRYGPMVEVRADAGMIRADGTLFRRWWDAEADKEAVLARQSVCASAPLQHKLPDQRPSLRPFAGRLCRSESVTDSRTPHAPLACAPMPAH